MTKMGDAKRAAKAANDKADAAVAKAAAVGAMDVVTHGHSWIAKAGIAAWRMNQAANADTHVKELKRKRKNKVEGAATALALLSWLASRKR